MFYSKGFVKSQIKFAFGIENGRLNRPQNLTSTSRHSAEEEEEFLAPIKREFGVASVDVLPPERAALEPQPELVSAVAKLVKGATASGAFLSTPSVPPLFPCPWTCSRRSERATRD